MKRRRALAVGLGLVAAVSNGCGETVISIVDRPTPSAGAAGATGATGGSDAGAGGVAGVAGSEGGAGTGGAGGGGTTGVGGSDQVGGLGGVSGGGAAGEGGEGGAPLDECPEDPTSLEPCPCGAGVPVTELCLLHHYTFDGDGTTLSDIAGGTDGRVVNTVLEGGAVALAGGTSDQYVELPPGLISQFPSVTVEVWTTWNGTVGLWQRLLDFGNSSAGPGLQGEGETYLFVTPRDSDGVLQASYSLAGPAAEVFVEAEVPLSVGTLEHVAVVVDGANSELSLYSNGALVGSAGPLSGTAQSIKDENVWLGRSQFAADAEYGGVIYELRIYSTARGAEQIAASFAAGPDQLPVQ